MPLFLRKRAEYCFESTVSEERTHWASLILGPNSVSSAKNSVSSLWHTYNRLRGAHWVLSPELREGKKTQWVRCLKPYSPKPYSACLRFLKDAAFLLTIWGFLLTIELLCLQLYFWSFFAYNLSFLCLQFEFFAYNWSFFTYNRKVCLISTLTDCKQINSTVCKNSNCR